MKIDKFNNENICKNKVKIRSQNYIHFIIRKNSNIAAIWGRFITGNSDKESSHIVGKSYERS